MKSGPCRSGPLCGTTHGSHIRLAYTRSQKRQAKLSQSRASKSQDTVAAASVTKEQPVDKVKAAFDQVTNEAEFLGTLKQVLNHPSAPDFLLPAFQDFYNNYKNAVVNSGVEGADERQVTKVMAAIADRVVHEFVDPFTFPNQHQRILEPYNYYDFGQIACFENASDHILLSGQKKKNYVRNLIDFDNSVLGGKDNLDKMEQYLSEGHNVVVLANHQTEADPAVWALLLEHTHARIATDVHYVAGDRVVQDPLCKPFSMGRNLFCVHSKKHMDDDPAIRDAKMRTNRQTLGRLSKELNKGGLLIWIAPSGGRDRPNEEDVWMPYKFDPSAVELMRQLLARAGPEGHLFPLAMHSGEMMPPPKSTEKSLGERRLTNFVGVGVSCGEELEATESMPKGPEGAALQKELADKAWQIVTDLYVNVEKAIRNPSERADFAQPWKS